MICYSRNFLVLVNRRTVAFRPVYNLGILCFPIRKLRSVHSISDQSNYLAKLQDECISSRGPSFLVIDFLSFLGDSKLENFTIFDICEIVLFQY